MSTAFHLHHISVAFGSHQVLRSIDLSVKTGERVAFIGPSGSGKTTLLRLLVAAVHPQQGDVHVLGVNSMTLSESALRSLRSRVGFVHQDLALVPPLSVLRNVISGRLGQQGWLRAVMTFLHPGHEIRSECEDLMERVGVPNRLDMRVDRLSGGQQQRVAIARAIFQNPELLLADEPVASVDPARGAAVVRLLSDLAKERSLTLAVSLHQPELARTCFDRVIGLREGRVMFDQPATDLSDDHLTELYALCDTPELEHISTRGMT